MKESTQQQPQINIDLKSTIKIENSEGGSIFQSGVILRRISKFVVASESDAIMPIPVFFDIKTRKILGEGLPPELREELKDEIL